MTRQTRLGDRNIADVKATITELPMQINGLKSNQHAFAMLYNLLYYITSTDTTYIDEITTLETL